jgi:hypothetical protein
MEWRTRYMSDVANDLSQFDDWPSDGIMHTRRLTAPNIA